MGGRSISAGYRKLADTGAEPEGQHARYNNLKSAFMTSVIISLILAIPTAFLAFLWGAAAHEVGIFAIPCICGILAVYALSIYVDELRPKWN